MNGPVCVWEARLWHWQFRCSSLTDEVQTVPVLQLTSASIAYFRSVACFISCFTASAMKKIHHAA